MIRKSERDVVQEESRKDVFAAEYAANKLLSPANNE
jgi:hypothetical protein